MTRLRHDRTPRLLVAALALGAFAAACWFDLGMQRGLLLSSDIKSRCWPWAPSSGSPALQAPLLSDPVWQFVPWLQFARRELISGRLPLWNPHQDGGVPLLGNAQSALLSPLIVPTLLLGVASGWNITLLLKLIVATLGVFLWLRDIGRSRMAASLGGFMFGMSGPYIAWLEHPHTLAAAPLPFLLLFGGVEVRGARARTRGEPGRVVRRLRTTPPGSGCPGAEQPLADPGDSAQTMRKLRIIPASSCSRLWQ